MPISTSAICAITFVLMSFAAVPNLAAQQSEFDQNCPTNGSLDSSLAVFEGVDLNRASNVSDFLEWYRAAVVVGRCVWTESNQPGLPDGEGSHMSRLYFVDSALGRRAVLVIRRYSDRFRLVADGWKGEENFVEPSRYWDSVAQQNFPGAPAANAISFDLDFKEMMRKFNIDPAAVGKSCEEYYKKELQDNGDTYRDVYSDEDIAGWPAHCAKTRDRFQQERQAILRKYGDAPFTRVLREIDITTVVVFHTVC